MSTSSKISSSALVHVNKRLRVGLSHVRLNFLLKLSAPLAFSVMAEYQPEEIGTSENGSRGSRMGITPLQKATSGR